METFSNNQKDNMQEEIQTATVTQMCVPAKKRMEFFVEMGQQLALSNLAEEIRKLQKSHPAAVGLTLAIAIIDRSAAELKAITTRRVLTIAADAGLPLGSHSLQTTIEKGEIVIRATHDDSYEQDE